jgi:probable addiction module antidote protein
MSKLKGAVSHHEKEVAELRADRELAVEYLKAAMEALGDPDARDGGLLALRTVAEAYGGLGAVAAEAGISRESLYRTLSPKGNPTLKTLLAILKAVGMRLSVRDSRSCA